jgi:hypothetical protein
MFHSMLFMMSGDEFRMPDPKTSPCIGNGTAYTECTLYGRTMSPFPFTIDCGSYGSSFKIYFFWNPYLLLNKTYSENEKETFYPWIDHIGKVNASILVLNTGPHYREDDEFIESIINLRQVTEMYPNMLTIYRSTTIGHRHFRPNFNSTPLQFYDNDNDELFHYHLFYHQNQLVRSLIDKHNLGFIYMDVYNMTKLRIDSHRDNLHYCLPGPSDAWIMGLINIIRIWDYGHSHNSSAWLQ